VRIWSAVGLAAASFVVAADARAQSRSAAELAYRSQDADCPDVASFRHLVAARLGFDPFEPGATDHVVVDFAIRSGKLEGRVEITRAPGPTRDRVLTVDRDHCGALAAALATTVAIALDSVRPPEPVPVDDAERLPAPPDVQSQGLKAAHTDGPALVAPAAPAATGGFALTAAVGASASAALGPAPMLGPELGLALRARSVSIEASVRAETTLGIVRASNGERLEATVLSGGIAPCAHAGRFAGCAFARFGSFQASAPDVATPSIRGLGFAAVGARASYALPISDALALRGALEGGFPLVRTSLEVDGSPIWVSPPVFVGVSFALLAKVL
jgi:hypothetical protein